VDGGQVFGAITLSELRGPYNRAVTIVVFAGSQYGRNVQDVFIALLRCMPFENDWNCFGRMMKIGLTLFVETCVGSSKIYGLYFAPSTIRWMELANCGTDLTVC